MGKKSIKTRSESAEDECPESAQFLMNRCFLIILLNMIMGFLPVTISGNKVRHSFCSLSTIFSIASAIALLFLTVVFAPLTVMLFLTETSTSTDILAIGILKASHIVGFLILILNSHRVARKLPSIWKNLVRCFQIAVVEVHGLSWRPLRKLIRFTFVTFFLYITVIVIAQLVHGNKKISDVVGMFYERVTELRNNDEITMVIAGYIIWDLAALSHVLVSIILTFFILVVRICLKSVNKQLKELVESTGHRLDRNHDPSNSNFWFDQNDDAIWSKLDRYKKVYGLCEDITGALSQSWGVPLIIESLVLIGNTLVNTFLMVTDVMALTGYGIRRYSNFTDYFSLILSSIIHFYFLFQLCVEVSKLVRESKKPLRILKNMKDQESILTRSKIASFKMDVSDVDITLTAANYFQVNKFLITTLVGSLTTYLIVLMQFKQQDTAAEHENTDCSLCGCVNETSGYYNYSDSVN